jgi:hypothetical protein
MTEIRAASLEVRNVTEVNMDVCQVSAGNRSCWSSGDMLVRTGCEHEHLGPAAPMCGSCADLCRQVAEVAHTTWCEQCGHPCRILMRVVETGETILF